MQAPPAASMRLAVRRAAAHSTSPVQGNSSSLHTRRARGAVKVSVLTWTPSYTAALEGSESITETIRVVAVKPADALSTLTAAAISAALSGVSGWSLPPTGAAVVVGPAVATACSEEVER